MDYKSACPDVKKRKEEFKKISYAHPNMIPAVIEAVQTDPTTPVMHTKFLIPKAYTFQDFQFNIRKRLKLNKNSTVYFVLGDKQIPSPEKNMLALYREYKDIDGFLYIKYSIESNFGSCTAV